MTSYLIGYIDARRNEGHEDPYLTEYTYGDVNVNGKKLRENVNQGDFLFFHRKMRKKRYITALYEMEKVLPVSEAQQDELIMLKYKNPHLSNENLEENETIVFGNPIASYVLEVPLEITKGLLNKLSRKPNFNEEQTDLAGITSALRSWKELNDEDVTFLRRKVEEAQLISILKDTYLSTEEIVQVNEANIEKFIIANPKELGNGLTYWKHQYVLKNGKRLDVLLRDEEKDEWVVVEIKKGAIGKDVLSQIKGYIKEINEEFNSKKVRGIIVCDGILPIYEEDYNRLEDYIEVYFYSWKFNLRKYS